MMLRWSAGGAGGGRWCWYGGGGGGAGGGGVAGVDGLWMEGVEVTGRAGGRW